jgi:hypothetical protein
MGGCNDPPASPSPLAIPFRGLFVSTVSLRAIYYRPAIFFGIRQHVGNILRLSSNKNNQTLVAKNLGEK